MLTIAPAALPAVVTNCVFTSLAFITVSLRLGTRLFVLKNIGVDDYLITVAVIASIAFLTVIMLQVKAGLGRMILPEELPGFLYALWATVPIYNLALIMCKLSITVQCYRVLRTPKMQRFLRTYLCVLVIYGLWTLFSSVFNCYPVNYYWAFMQGVQGSCMDKSAITFSNAALNITTDIILLVVPVPLLWRLQIPKKQKLILMFLFGVGIFACITSIIRLQSLYMISVAPPELQSVYGVSIAVWSCIEINTAIICASIPALKPLVVKVFPKMLLSDLYARTKRTKGAAYYAARGGNSGTLSKHENNNINSKPSTGSGHLRSNHSIGGGGISRSQSTAVRTEIQVEQSFEMRSVPVSSMGREDTMEDDRDGKTSRDGSEKNLVVSSWQDENYDTLRGGKKVTITSHPREMV
ncbi:hypothetical protein B0T17DRAFT_566464 [Bombardia bombarda]|uniref:Rhodopsin domain-containing protein n=1 Tax=Bombardia bombarda TaxID=252184 RepID=A0AA39U2H0_9PEZI|nr:hypothetical protein B0T17DRAFT_566464 [Bombardia bombarda]